MVEGSGWTCLSSTGPSDRERYRARVVVEGAVNGALSASGMIACEGRKYICATEQIRWRVIIITVHKQ
jgi:hypothetical protein